jgi:hypothetical protein
MTQRAGGTLGTSSHRPEHTPILAADLKVLSGSLAANSKTGLRASEKWT